MQQWAGDAAARLQQAILSRAAPALLAAAGLWLTTLSCTPQLTLTQARQAMKAGELQRACDAMQQLATRRTSSAEQRLDSLRGWIDCLDRSGRLERAEPVLATLPGAALRHYGRALALVARRPRQLDRALQLLDRAAHSAPEQVEIPYRAAVLLMADERPGAALRWLERARKTRDSAAVAVARAHALLDLGRSEQALAQARRSLRLVPTLRDLARGRALIQRVARRSQAMPAAARTGYTEALALLNKRDLAGQCVKQTERLLLDHPHLAPLHTLLGLAQLRLGNRAEAVVALRQASRLNPLDATNPLYLAVIYQRQGRAQRAIEHYRRALRLDPFRTEATRQLGQLLLRQGQNEAAARAFDRLLVLDQRSDRSRRLAARAHLAAGEQARAELLYAALARQHPDDFEVNLRLGQLLLRRHGSAATGEAELLRRARAYWKRAAATRPEDQDVVQLGAELQQLDRQ